jgi:hypothetical protein
MLNCDPLRSGADTISWEAAKLRTGQKLFWRRVARFRQSRQARVAGRSTVPASGHYQATKELCPLQPITISQQGIRSSAKVGG